MPATEDSREVFEHLYDTAGWSGGSGQGSRSSVTQVYRAVVECLIASSDVGSVVDAGCGDWEFARLIDWSPVNYLGLDVVPAVIAMNRDNFSSPDVRFECVDFSDMALPYADLLLCKDVLQHWPIEWVHRFLHRIRGRYRYTLLTNDVASVHCPPESLNAPIPVGAWRTLDLEQPPFRLRPDWRIEYDIVGEWTKRSLLLVSRRHKLRARLGADSALNRVRRHGDWVIAPDDPPGSVAP